MRESMPLGFSEPGGVFRRRVRLSVCLPTRRVSRSAALPVCLPKRSSCFSTCALRAGEGGCCLGLPPHGAPPSIPRRQPRWVSSTRRIPSRSAFRESLRYGYPAPRAAPQHTHHAGLTKRGLQAVTSPGELLRERNSLRRAFGPGAWLPVRKEKVPPKAWGGRKRFGRRDGAG